MRKGLLFLLAFILIGCSSAKLHNLSEEKEFAVSAAKNEEVWSRAHDHLARTKPEKFSTGFVTDYSIILTGYLDNRKNINFTKTQFTPYYYNLILTRHKNENNFVYYFKLYGQDYEDDVLYIINSGKVNKNSKESGLLQEEIEKFYKNITGEKR